MADLIPCEILPLLMTEKTGGADQSVRRVRWANIKAGDTCQEFDEAGAFAGKTVHVYGTAGGSTLVLKGRGEQETGCEPLTMQDLHGNPASFAADGGLELLENYPFVVPVLSGGDGATNWTVVLILAP